MSRYHRLDMMIEYTLAQITHVLIVLHGESFDWGHLVREGWSCENNRVTHFYTFCGL